MHSIPHSLVTLFLILSLLLSLWAGSRLGTSARHRGNHDKDQLGTIQGAILGLLGLILGFSLSGAMGRFVDRQDALAKEAAAIETAYERAELLPSADVIRASLHEYAVLRLELFGQDSTNKSMEIEARMRDCYIAARTAVYENARAMPQLASFAVTGMESVQDEFARRSALERRALPLEMVLALVVASCLSIGIIGYGIGLAERRSFGPAMTLAGLVALTLGKRHRWRQKWWYFGYCGGSAAGGNSTVFGGGPLLWRPQHAVCYRAPIAVVLLTASWRGAGSSMTKPLRGRSKSMVMNRSLSPQFPRTLCTRRSKRR